MPKASIRYPEESFDSLNNRFNRAVEKSGILKDYHAREFYEQPSQTRKRAKAAAVKRWERKRQEAQLLPQRMLEKARRNEKKDTDKKGSHGRRSRHDYSESN